ncbi:MAG: LapA family protein [Acidimicrobiia bacterium]|nr:LapA family protein [Acidimicrobiia bacterium]
MLLAVLAVIVIVENGDRVQFDVLWWTWSTRLWVALSAAAAVGVVIGLLFPVFVRRQRAIRKERREARLALTRLQERKAEPAEPSSSSRAGSPGSAA